MAFELKDLKLDYKPVLDKVPIKEYFENYHDAYDDLVLPTWMHSSQPRKKLPAWKIIKH